MVNRHVGFHWSARAYDEAVALGATFCWMNADTIGQPDHADDWRDWEASGLDAILKIEMTEARLHDTAGVWQRDMTNLKNGLAERGLLTRVLALQIDDELHTRMAHQPSIMADDQWPGLVHLAPTDRIRPLNVWLGQRARELRDLWGDDWPAAGLGIAEAGGVAEVTFPGLKWVGLNVYRNRGYYGDQDEPAKAMAAVYDQAAAGPYPLMPVIGVFTDGLQSPPSLWELGAAYGPILDAHAARCWALGIFCLHHPSVYDNRHPPGRGLLEIDPIYRAAVKAFIRDWRGLTA